MNSKMNKYLVIFQAGECFDTVDSLIAEAYSADDLEQNLEQVLMDAGLDEGDADYIVEERLYYFQHLDDMLKNVVIMRSKENEQET